VITGQQKSLNLHPFLTDDSRAGKLALGCSANVSRLRGGPSFSFRGSTEKSGARAPLEKIQLPLDLIVRGRGLSRKHIHATAFLIKLYLAINQREKRPIPPCAHILAGNKFRPALAHQNAACGDNFATEPFYPKSLAITVTAIPAAALTFFMSHKFLEINVLNF